MVTQHPPVNPIASHHPIGSTIETGALPGAPNIGQQPTPGRVARIMALPEQEYVAGGQYTWYANYIRSLPWPIDDVTADFGDDLYERMLLEPQVSAGVEILKAAILEDGISLRNPIEEPSDPDYAAAQRIVTDLTYVIEHLDQALDDVLWNMLDAVYLGNRIGELVYALVTLPEHDAPYLALKAIKVKPRHAVAFAVDVYLNVIGLLGLMPGQGAPVQAGSILSDPQHTPNLLPREKFAVLTFRPVESDPRGSSKLRPAYNAWWQLQQLYPEWLKFLTQFAGPSLVGTTAEHAQSVAVLDSDGNPTGAVISPETSLLTALETFRNGSIVALPFGTEVAPLSVDSGGGAAFIAAIEHQQYRITKAILGQTLATEEGEHQARAAAEVHQDMFDTLVRQVRKSVIRMVREDILRPLVEYNYPPAMQHLIPLASLGETEEQDFADKALAVAALQKAGYLHPTQYPGIDEELGLPERDETLVPQDELTALQQQNEALSAQIAQALPQPGQKPPTPAQPAPPAPRRGVA